MNASTAPRADLSDVRRRYDAWHDTRAALDDLDQDLANPWNSFVRAHVGAVEGRRVLDVACGRGQLSRFLAESGARVLSADFSSQAIAEARRRLIAAARPARLLAADAQRLPIRDGSVDLVVSCETIEHLGSPRTALAEFARVLAPHGRLILTFPSHLNLVGLHRLYLAARGRPYDSGAGAQPIERWLFAPLVLQRLRGLGFRIACREGLAHAVPVPGRPPLRLGWLERARWAQRATWPVALHVGVVAERRA